MSRTIAHFMWGYQDFYRVSQEVSAGHIFRQLDDRLQPEVFLVGVLAPGAVRDSFPACVEPEDDFWIQSEEFDGVLEIAAPMRSAYPESQMLHSHPSAQRSQDDFLFRTSIRDAILTVLRQHQKSDPSIEYFVSIPERVESYLVSIVLGLQRDVLSSYHRLTRGSVAIHEFKSMPVARSLLDAAIFVYFADACEELRKPNPGLPTDSRRDAEEVVQAAGRRLARDSVYRAAPNEFGWHGFFRACSTISSLRYEKGAGVGRFVIASKDHEAVRENITFAADLRLSNFRSARKLLQLASSGSGLHSDGVRVFGLVDVDIAKYSSEDEDLFEVHFLDHHHWALVHAGQVLMRVRYGQPYLNKPATYEAKLPRDLPRIFKDISTQEVDLVVSLVRQAEKESHGTLLMVSPAAREEAERLKGQGIMIERHLLTPAVLGQLTAIDGAVMIDPSGYCYAIGVILDGIAKDSGDPARGARYNSALRYVSSSDSPCLAVVISEDGGVDLVPDLRPMVRRSLIDVKVQELAGLIEQGAIPRRRYNHLVDWLSEHRFYLLEHDCESINTLVARIEELLDREEPMRTKIVREPFVANSALNVARYYEHEGSNEKPEGPG